MADKPCAAALCTAVPAAAQNVGASVQCRDPEHLYELVNSTIGTMRGVQEVEICSMVRRFTQEGTRLDGTRLRRRDPRSA